MVATKGKCNLMFLKGISLSCCCSSSSYYYILVLHDYVTGIFMHIMSYTVLIYKIITRRTSPF